MLTKVTKTELTKEYFHIITFIFHIESQKYERKKNMQMKNHSSNFSIFGGSTKQKRKHSNNQPASLMSNIVALKLKHN